MRPAVSSLLVLEDFSLEFRNEACGQFSSSAVGF
jgi:hypothetical protein